MDDVAPDTPPSENAARFDVRAVRQQLAERQRREQSDRQLVEQSRPALLERQDAITARAVSDFLAERPTGAEELWLRTQSETVRKRFGRTDTRSVPITVLAFQVWRKEKYYNDCWQEGERLFVTNGGVVVLTVPGHTDSPEPNTRQPWQVGELLVAETHDGYARTNYWMHGFGKMPATPDMPPREGITRGRVADELAQVEHTAAWFIRRLATYLQTGTVVDRGSYSRTSG